MNEEIVVRLSDPESIEANVLDVNYIPGYEVAEQERRANEVVRQENEASRIALYEDMENKLATGYFDGEDGVGLNYNWSGTQLGVKREDEQNYQYVDLKGDAGEDGVSPTATVTQGTGSATITVTDASGTTTAVLYDGEKGEQGDKGDPGEIEFQVVNSLPASGTTGIIYLVPLAEPDISGNNYAEYIWVDNAWELLGKIGVQLDLTDYVKNTDYASTTTGGVIKTSTVYLTELGSGALRCSIVPYSNYSGITDKAFISKGTLDNVLADSNIEYTTNKVTSISSSSTDTQYPSAKCVYDYIDTIVGDINSALDTINGEVI